MTDSKGEHPDAEDLWRSYLNTGKLPDYANPAWYERSFFRPFAKRLPSSPRCRLCYYPFHGIGGALVRGLLGIVPSRLNPQICNVCERAADTYRGGAELELSLLFADVRGSTTLAERMSPAAYSQLIDRFYRATTGVLFEKDALVEKLIGDEVTGFFVPGFAGPHHARVAVEAGDAILRATGHADAAGPWIPVGVGVHTGVAYVGAVTAEGSSADLAVLGDTANTAARLASQAGPGELILSEATRLAAGLDSETMAGRMLELKGKREPIAVWIRKTAARR